MSGTYAINTNPLMRFVMKVMPSRMKRIIYLASLTAIAKETNIPEKMLIKKLNRVLHLSSTGDDALKLPIHLSQLIWANKVVFRQDVKKMTMCEPEEAKACAERIVNATPSWFSYGSASMLIDDIMALFRKENDIFDNQVTH